MPTNDAIVLNDFKKQWLDIREATLTAVDKVGNSGWLILGQETLNFEKKLADKCGIAFAVGCANGLDAIEIAFRCLGIQPGDHVLTTPLSAFATTLAILRAGGVPVFVDVDDSGLIDLDLSAKILKNHPEIRFFLPVHLFGHALDSNKLKKLKHDFPAVKIIEDCAQAIGAQSFNLPVGTIGDAAAISFYPTKNLGCLGDGGALLFKDSESAKMARCIRDYGQTEKYVHAIYGMNSRLDELQSAILHEALLPKLDQATHTRTAIAEKYLREITNQNLHFPVTPDGSSSVWHLFPILVNGSKKSFREHLSALGIATGEHYPILISDQPALTNITSPIVRSPLTKANRFAQQEVSIPIHPYLTSQEVDRIIHACNSWNS